MASCTIWRWAPPMSSERPSRKTDLPAGSAGGEDEFIAAMAPGAGRHPPQLEAALAVEIQNLLGLGHFERVAADPVDHVPPRIHAARHFGSICLPGSERLAADEILHHRGSPQAGEGGEEDAPFE